MIKRFVLIPVVVVLMGGLLFGGCAKPAPAPAPPAPAPAPAPAPTPTGPEEILVGFPAPLTGACAGFGQGLVFGAQVAVEDINKQGGVYVKEYDCKIPVKLIVVDEESDSTKTGTLAEDLVLRDKVHLLTTPDCPVFLQAPVCTVADRYKVPNVVGGGPAETWMSMRMDVTPPWEYSWFTGFAIATPPPEGDFRYGKPGYTLQDTYLHAVETYGGQTNKKVGVFAVDDPDGRGWYALFPSALKEMGYNPVGTEKGLGLFAPETKDFTPLIQEWKANDVGILLGDARAPDFGTMWRQCHTLEFKPKMVFASEAGLFYTNIIAWGGDLPNGICCELWWSPLFDCPGIGDTTPQSLAQRWFNETGEPLNPGIGHGYHPMQILFDAVERAGTLDSSKVNKALGETDVMTINYRMVFDPETHVSPMPLFLGQWQKTDKPEMWENQIVYSAHDFLPATAEFLFPIPYE